MSLNHNVSHHPGVREELQSTVPQETFCSALTSTQAMLGDSTEPENLKTDVQTLLITAEVHEAAGDDSFAASSLKRASELQRTILDRSR